MENKTGNLFIHSFIDLFFPRSCNGCGNILSAREKVICGTCKLNLPKTSWQNFKGNPLEKTFYGRVEVERATSFLFFEKGGVVQNYLHNLKYKGQKQLGVILGIYFGNDLLKSKWIKNIDLIVPIPLHSKKLKLRGYNQSTMLAIGMAKALKVPYSNKLLTRVRHTETQTLKDRFERQLNVKQAFKCEQTSSENILIVDDVSTTGATFESAIQSIKKANPTCTIYVATLAIAN